MGRKLAYGMSLNAELVRPAGALMANLYRLFEKLDCSLAEINPLVVTGDHRLLAADAKLSFDDDALHRHPELPILRDLNQEDPLEVEASQHGVNYIRLDGDVGCMVNGAGLAMATMDIIKFMGAEPANFLDVGGGASEEQIRSAFTIMLSDPKVKRVLVNVFGGILRCDVAARGIIGALSERGINIPLVVRMRGTNAEEGQAPPGRVRPERDHRQRSAGGGPESSAGLALLLPPRPADFRILQGRCHGYHRGQGPSGGGAGVSPGNHP